MNGEAAQSEMNAFAFDGRAVIRLFALSPASKSVKAARIRALRSKDQGRQNVPEQRRGNGALRNDLAVAEAEPPTGGEA
jgi:hypothetical protein